MKVYLAGAMEGESLDDMRGWRQAWIDRYPDVEFLDPTRRKPFHDQPPSLELSTAIFRADLEDIVEADLVVVSLSTSAPQIGTVLELGMCLFKDQLTREVLVVYQNEHPFLDVIFRDSALEGFQPRVYNMEEAYRSFDAYKAWFENEQK